MAPWAKKPQSSPRGERAARLGASLYRPRVLTRGTAWVGFRLRPCGFTPRDWRDHLVALPGPTPDTLTPGRITYDLRRLRLQGFIERLSKTHRYPVTGFGVRSSLFFTRVPARILRLSPAMPNAPPLDTVVQRCFQQLHTEIDRSIEEAKLAA